MTAKTVRDLTDAELRGKRAVVRADFNVPLDDQRAITDDTRIKAALPTLRFLLERGARPIVLSHLGRPKAKFDPRFSLDVVAVRLQQRYGVPIAFVAASDTDEALQRSKSLRAGEVLLLENTRFLPGEEAN
ncbi:MAG: phosphoglycerate kinase, partial [Gemmatimonadaceae bacterium]